MANRTKKQPAIQLDDEPDTKRLRSSLRQFAHRASKRNGKRSSTEEGSDQCEAESTSSSSLNREETMNGNGEERKKEKGDELSEADDICSLLDNSLGKSGISTDDQKANNNAISDVVVKISKDLGELLDSMKFKKPVAHVYNVYEYAFEPHATYIRKHAYGKKRVLFVGMNPGPFGMAQTGVPFGDVIMVRDWVGITGEVGKPKGGEHPKRPVNGFKCHRSEVSGQRFWGMMSKVCGDGPDGAARFFAQCFVYNYCPLVFMGESGVNITPDKLPADEKKKVLDACDKALCRLVECLEPEYVIGVGNFAADRAKKATIGCPSVKVVESIIHPSPASPLANRGWSENVEAKLESLGIIL